MASSVTSEYPTPNKPCRCAEGDKNIWTTKASENSDKPPQNCPNCQILKSGTLFLASKGIGWTSWKKRWFVLTRTSLVFYRNDPNALPQKGGEANPTLGGIDLNTSGSVVVKADKKLLTVLFPDGRDGRTFTLKAETSEELQEWKTALENALAQAPSAANVMGQNGILRNEMGDSIEASGEQCKDKRSVQSMVIGRPVLLALEEIDGSPSFLEKALRFIEDYGIKVEGILRQSADVEEVERRVQEYEQGKVEFSAEEDAHVIGDCIKHVLRELPSSPVPASCCTALVEAYRTGRGNRLNAIRAAISETFPDPNRRLLQRILKMMRTVASYRTENRMSPSGLAACMAPLLLRPLLAGDCEFEDDFNMGGDGSIQLLKAAAAANHAQAIVIILLEDYDRIFDEELLHDGSSSEIYTDSEEEVDDDNEDDDDDDGEDDDDDDDVDDIEDDFSTDNDIAEVGGYCDAQNGVEADIEDDFTDSSCGSGTLSRSDSDVGSVSSDNESIEDYSTDSSSPKDTEATDRQSSSLDVITLQKDASENQSTDELTTQHADLKDSVFLDDSNSKISTSQEDKSFGDVDTPTSQMQKCSSNNFPERMAKFHEKSMDSMSTSQRHARWGRAPARKNLSMESMDVPSEDKDAIQRLETIKDDLQDKLAEEVKGNALLQASLERRKEVLHSRQSALEKEVERLRELLQKERDLREALESRLTNKTREEHEETNLAEADIKNLKQKVADLREQLNLHAFCESCNKRLHAVSQSEENNQQKIADSPLLQQNINSSKLDIGSSTLSSEEFHAQIEDPSSTDGEIPQRGPPEQTNQTSFSGYSGLPSTEESSCIGATGIANKFSSTDGSTLSKASHQEVKQESQNISCLPGSQHEKEKLSTKKNRRKSLESGSISYRQEPTEVVKNSAPDTFTSKDENHMSGDDHAKSKPKTQHSHPSSDRRPSKMPQHHEEPTTVACDPSKKSSSGLENSISGDDQESAKVKTQDSRSSADRRPSKNLLPITVGCDSSKKSTSRGENSRTREDHEKAKAKTQDSHPSGDKRPSKNLLPHEDPVTVACDSPKNASSRGENSKSGEDHEKKAKTQSSIPSGDRQPSKNPLPREEPATVACDSPRKATSRDENTMSGEDHENAKAKTQDLPPSVDRRPSKNILLHEEPATVPCDSSKKSTSSGENSMSGDDHESARDKTQDSYASAADWRPSKNELPHEEPAQVSCDSSKSTSRNENPKIGLDAEKLKAQNETPVSSVDKQSSKQPPNTTNQGSKKPVLSQNPSIEEQAAFNRVPASKKTKTWDEMLKEPPHSPSLQKRKPSQKLQPYTSGSNSVKPVGSPEDATVGSSAGFKKPTGSRPEEAPPTSSTALTRLTNRLNFLKERRVQLVNELQNLDANRASGPEHPPSNTR